MIERVPALVAAICLSVYWGWVLIKLVKLAKKIGKDPNAMPRERVGQLMRVVWYPCILALIWGLWMAACVSPARLSRTGAGWAVGWLWQPTIGWWWGAMAASVLCVGCTVATFVCWRRMGRSWRIGIDPNETLAIVSTGPYRWVRHPIYALRMVLNVCVFVMAPTPLVGVMAGIDFVLLQVEARREERYMEATHGQAYRTYKNSVGRFVPRAFVG